MERDPIFERLSALGCDVEGAMNRMMQDAGFYRECLSMFAEDPQFDALGEALHAGNAKAAFEHAHALKGVAANLGLTPLYEQAGLLVEPLRKGLFAGTEELYRELLLRRDALRRCL